MATTTLVTVAPTGGTSAKAYNKGTATTATNGTATSVSYSGTRITLLTVVWTDLSDGDYDFALIGPDGELGYDVLRVSGALAVLLSEQNLAQLAGASSIVERSPTDAKAIKFRFPVSGATITGTVSIDNAASFSAVTGAISFLHTVDGKHWYVLAYNAADRPTSEGTAHYKFTDGTNKAEVKLRVAVAGGSGGGPVDLDEIKGPGWDEDTDTLEKIRDAITSIATTSVVIPSPISEVIGMPETLEIGDSYDDETPIKLYVRDDADDPVTVFSGHDLADLDFTPTFTIAPTPGSSRGRVVGTVTYVPASGPDEGYLKVEISSLQSRRAVEGESSVQCVLKWDGYEKTLLSTTVRWLPRI